jgi:FkbM family methyltransferase
MLKIIYKYFKEKAKKTYTKKIDGLINLLEIEEGISLLDVGAAGDIHQRFKFIEKHLNYYGFEPDKRSREELLKQKNNCKSYFLYDKIVSNNNDDVILNLCKAPMTSSILKPNYDFLNLFDDKERVKIVKEIKFKPTTIDELNIKQIDFIKMDIQGAELMAIEGAESSLEKVLGLELELEFLEIYKSQPLFGEITQHLHNKGFEFYDFVRLTRWDRDNIYNEMGQCTWGDGLFLRTPEYIIENYLNNNQVLKRYIIICLLYKKFDLINKIIYSIDNNKIVPDSFKNQLNRLRRKSIKSKLFRRRFVEFLNIFGYQNEGAFIFD